MRIAAPTLFTRGTVPLRKCRSGVLPGGKSPARGLFDRGFVNFAGSMELRDDPDAELHRRLITALGREAVLTSIADRSAYAMDALRESMLPNVVVLPRSTGETAMAVRIAAAFEQPIIARGAGTSLTGASAPIGGGVVVSTVRMNRILEIDARRRRARVQPGVVTLDLSYAAVRNGLFFAVDPASERVSTIGGNAGTNAAGPHAFAYGRMAEQIIGIEFVDARGEIRTASVDDRAPDIAAAFCGSEGTLGIMTMLDVRLRPAPEAIRVAVAAFSDIDGALEASTAIRERCPAVVALELLDEIALSAVAATFPSPYPAGAKAMLLIEFAGFSEDVKESAERAEILVQRYACEGFQAADSPAQAQKMWLGRQEVRRCLGTISADVEIHDVAVPRSRMSPYIRSLEAIAARHGVRISVIGHVGDGGLHPAVLFDRAQPQARQAAFLAGNDIMEAAVAQGGGVGEYGIGTAKRTHAHARRSPADQEAQTRLRRAFDAQRALNPEKLVPFAADEFQ